MDLLDKMHTQVLVVCIAPEYSEGLTVQLNFATSDVRNDILVRTYYHHCCQGNVTHHHAVLTASYGCGFEKGYFYTSLTATAPLSMHLTCT